MSKNSMCFSRLIRTVAMAGVLCFVGSYASIAIAAQGCGQGFHRTINGRCVLNHPGPHATPVPHHRGCWRNGLGQLRCYR